MVWNNHLIVCDGRTDNEDSITDSVEPHAVNNASSLPLKASGKHAVITDNGKLYLLGGQMGNAVHYCELHQLIAIVASCNRTQRHSKILIVQQCYR